MDIIRMSGGLGNQMFQYALYMKLISQGIEVKFDDINEYRHDNARPIMLSVFGLEYPRASWDEITKITDGSLKISHRIRRKLFGRKSREYREQGFGFDPEILKQEHAYLCGVFQSEKYFEDIAQQVRETFRFTDPEDMKLPESLLEATQESIKLIQDTDNAVSIHIRRGDYLMNEELYGGICTEKYYEGAIRYMLDHYPDAVFYVFSNEARWVKNWIDMILSGKTEAGFTQEEMHDLKDRFVIMESNTEYTGYLDMLLMTKCKHNIIANSSFSWWGAWLNDNPEKSVVAPSKWLNERDCEDVYVKGMVLINAKGRVERTVR